MIIDTVKIMLSKRQILMQGRVDANRQEEITSAILGLNALDNRALITMFIDSGGGSPIYGGYLSDIVRTSEAPVHGIVIGLCASAAFDILQSCTRRIAYTHSKLIFHSPRISDFRIMANREKMIAWFDTLRLQSE